MISVLCVSPCLSVSACLCVIQVSLGGLDDIHALKNARRLDKGLPPMTEDTHDVCKHMRASSPPASAADLIDQHQQIRRSLRTAKKVCRFHLLCLLHLLVVHRGRFTWSSGRVLDIQAVVWISSRAICEQL